VNSDRSSWNCILLFEKIWGDLELQSCDSKLIFYAEDSGDQGNFEEDFCRFPQVVLISLKAHSTKASSLPQKNRKNKTSSKEHVVISQPNQTLNIILKFSNLIYLFISLDVISLLDVV
jgi:hypothetical protein